MLRVTFGFAGIKWGRGWQGILLAVASLFILLTACAKGAPEPQVPTPSSIPTATATLAPGVDKKTPEPQSLTLLQGLLTDYASPYTSAYTDAKPSDVLFTLTIDGSSREVSFPSAYPGRVVVRVSPGTAVSAMNKLVEGLGGHIVAQIPAAGLYWVQVQAGAEAGFISAVGSQVLRAYPDFVEVPRDTVPAEGTGDLPSTTSRFQVDFFRKPICILNCDPSDIGTRVYLTPEMEPTTNALKAGTHGDLVQYLSRNEGQQPTKEVLGIDVGLVGSPGEYKIISVAKALWAAEKQEGVTTINLSMGPPEHKDPKVKADLERINLENLLTVLEAAGRAGDKAMIIQAAGNEAFNMTGVMGAVQSHPKRDNLLLVGSIDEDDNIDSQSNYSIDVKDMLYVPSTRRFFHPDCPQDGCVLGGTSFAAPQVEYLVNAISKQRPDLTPTQIRQTLSDAAVSPRMEVTTANGTKMLVPVIEDPYSPDTLKVALEVAGQKFPSKSTPTPIPTRQPTPTPSPTPRLESTIEPARNLTGTWRGGLNLVKADDQDCDWSGSLVLNIQQSGSTLTGTGQATFSKGVPLMEGVDCPTDASPIPLTLTGTVSSSRVQINAGEGVDLTGSFTADLMSGTLTWSPDFKGCFQASRAGAGIPDCGNPFVKPTPTPAPTRTPTPTPSPTPTPTPTVVPTPTIAAAADVTSVSCVVSSKKDVFESANNRTVTYVTWQINAAGTATGAENTRVLIRVTWDTWTLNSGSWLPNDGVSTGGRGRYPGIRRQPGQSQTTTWSLSGTWADSYSYKGPFTITVTTDWGGSGKATCQS